MLEQNLIVPVAPRSSLKSDSHALLLCIGVALVSGGCSGTESGTDNDADGGTATGGNTASGGADSSTGGHTSSGGSEPTIATGGMPSSGGGAGIGGDMITGGSASDGGSSSGSGGDGTGTGGTGSGADGTGGTGSGGDGAGGDGTGGDGTGGTGSGGGGSDACQKGTTMGNEVLFIGESFVAASSIPAETSNLAQTAGSLQAGDSYVDKSVSGTWIGNGAGNSIPNQYKDNADGVRFVLMNGGGNDCWQGGQESDRQNALNAASDLFDTMATNGVEKVVYFFYPDPIGSQFANLTECLDILRPEMKSLCEGQTSPECHWLDLREAWDGHPEYTSDGIHVAGPGNLPTATAIYEVMESGCVAP